MKIMTIMGTRPEIIRLSRVIPLLDTLVEHCLVYTGQNYDRNLSEIFFEDLKVRRPDHHLECRGDSMMTIVSKILTSCEKVILQEKPDRLLILGDTNSGLSAIVAKRLGIPVYHMEAGNRCFDDRVPEEVNRRIIDHSSDVLLPYTERSRANLLDEGLHSSRIYVTGNPIKEVLDHYGNKIAQSSILKKLGLSPQKYFLVTLHRAENVDHEQRLEKFLKAFQLLNQKYGHPIVCSMHPRTRSKIDQFKKNITANGILPIDPPGLFDFVTLEKNATCVLSDSGTVQEECCIFKVPTVTLRDVTERPETLEVGSNILSGCEPDSILRCVEMVLKQPGNWQPPREYLADDVSHTVARIITSDR